MKVKFILLFFLSISYVYSQDTLVIKNNSIIKDTLMQTSDSLVGLEEGKLPIITKLSRRERISADPLTPAKVAFYSAVLPGLGQAYLGGWQYAKIPFFYITIGWFFYYYLEETRLMNTYRNAYKRRALGYFDDEYIDVLPNPDKLLEGMYHHREQRNVGLAVFIGLYLINILDANTSAHLLQFNVSDKLVLKPKFQTNFSTSIVALNLNYKF